MSDKKQRISCLVMALVTCAIGFLAYGLSLPEAAIWTLAAIASVYAIAGIVGPAWLRWALLAGFIVDA